MSNVKTFNLELKVSQTHGQRADEPFAQLGYRSRQNPKQSCYIPDDAVTEHGVYHTILNRENARTGSTTTKTGMAGMPARPNQKTGAETPAEK